MRSLAIVAVVGLLAQAAQANTLEVGPGQPYSKPCDAIAAAQANDVVEVAPGTYTDSCSINVAGLTLRGVGGRPKIDLSATDHPAGYKGIYVLAAEDITIENLELMGAHISDGNGANGAGLRIQANSATVRGCYIHDNQDGILTGPAQAGQGTITIEYSEFDHNGLGDGCTCSGCGCTHNLYIGDHALLVFRYNWTHHVADDVPDKGHLLKSRAEESQILYNRVTGENGHDSYAIDLPNGGLGIIVGNLVEKGPSGDNSTLLTYGEEGLARPDKRLFVANNTFVNDFTKGTFINVASGGTLTAHNNLFVGPGTVSSTGALSADNLATSAPLFVDATNFDYHLKSGSPAIDQGVDPGSADTFSLTPANQYVHPANTESRSTVNGTIDIGAYEFGNVAVPQDAGQPGLDASSQPGLDASSQPGLDASTQPGEDASSIPPADAAGAGVDSGTQPQIDSGVDSSVQPLDASAAGGGDAGLGSVASSCGCVAGAASAPALLAAVFALGLRRRRTKS
jgi:nitrous oxidase accessory protein NosD